MALLLHLQPLKFSQESLALLPGLTAQPSLLSLCICVGRSNLPTPLVRLYSSRSYLKDSLTLAR